jgi:hypothetical protein
METNKGKTWKEVLVWNKRKTPKRIGKKNIREVLISRHLAYALQLANSRTEGIKMDGVFDSHG